MQEGNATDNASGAGTGKEHDGIRGEAKGNAPVPLSVLDLVNVGVGYSSGDALRATVETARLAEQRGFTRYWVAEHHSMPGVASSSPAVILSHLAARTDRIRLGSGGVMLPNHAPLVIAEQFGTLEALAPGRIDLGLGRAPGTDGATAAALRRTVPHTPPGVGGGPPGEDRGSAPGLREGADEFPQQLAELIRFLDGDFPDGHRYSRIHAVPGPVQGEVSRPPVWLLGSSGFSAELAGRLGLPFAFAHHFSSRNTLPALDLYRESFSPSAVLDEPYALIGAAALAADDEAQARRQVLTGALAMLRLRTGRPGLVPSPEEAEAYPFSAAEGDFVESWLANVTYGTPDAVRDGLDALAKRTGADELMLTANAHTPSARVRSYRLIADAYELP